MKFQTHFLFVLLALYIFFQYNSIINILPSYIHSIFLYLMLGCTLIYCFLYKNFKLDGFQRWYFLFVTYSFLLGVFCENCDWNTFYQMVICIIIIFCISKILLNIKQIKYLAIIYAVSSIVMGITIVATKGIDALIYNSMMGERLGTEETGNANIFTMWMMYAAVFSSWLSVFSKSKEKVLYYICFGLQLLLMAMSGGRKTIIAVFICWFFCLYKSKADKKQNSTNKIFTIFLIGLVLFISLWAIQTIPFLYDIIGERMMGMFDLFSGKSSSISGDEIRTQMIDIGLSKWIDAPLWGHGLDAFKFYNRTVTGNFFYSHNNYVEMLYNFGLVGFFLYYSFFVKVAIRLKNMPEEMKIYKCLGYTILIELLIFQMGGVDYFLIANMIQLWIAYKIPNFKWIKTTTEISAKPLTSGQ